MKWVVVNKSVVESRTQQTRTEASTEIKTNRVESIIYDIVHTVNVHELTLPHC